MRDMILDDSDQSGHACIVLDLLDCSETLRVSLDRDADRLRLNYGGVAVALLSISANLMRLRLLDEEIIARAVGALTWLVENHPTGISLLGDEHLPPPVVDALSRSVLFSDTLVRMLKLNGRDTRVTDAVRRIPGVVLADESRTLLLAPGGLAFRAFESHWQTTALLPIGIQNRWKRRRSCRMA
jgi:hypothetical protein